jgi:hypothetical protein
LDGTTHFSDPIQINTSTEVEIKDAAPEEFALFQNYPNPFNPETEIKFSVESTAKTRLDVFNLLGQNVATLFDDVAEAGSYYKVHVDGSSLASGVYLYRLQSGNKSESKKLLLLK